MYRAGVVLLLAAAACGQDDNVVVGGINSTSITPTIVFDNIQSVISGRVHLFDNKGVATGALAQVVIISDRPGLCNRLQQNHDYFRNPPEDYLALLLFLPANNHLGKFLPGRAGDEGTFSEVIGVKQVANASPPPDFTRPVAPFTSITTNDCLFFGQLCYIGLTDWSEEAGGEAVGNFNLFYAPPPQLTASTTIPFGGKFKSSVCTTLDGTLLP